MRLVQHASDIIMVLASDGTIRYVSPAFETILGYPASEAVGMNGVELAYPDDLDVLRDAMVTGSPRHRGAAAEVRLCTRTRRWRWFDVIVTDLSQDPSVGGWVANLRDVTDRKAQAEALNEAQEVFRHAFDDAPIGIGLVALDGRILRVNRAMGVLLGRTQEDLIGRSVSHLTHPADLSESDDHRDRLTARRDRLVPDGEALRAARRLDRVGRAQRVARARHQRAAALPDRPAGGHHRSQGARRPAGPRRRARRDDRAPQPRQLHAARRVALLEESTDTQGRGAVHRPRPLQDDQRQPGPRARRRARRDGRRSPARHLAAGQHRRAVRR